MHRQISVETNEVKKAELLRLAAAEPNLDANSFLSFLQHEIVNPHSSDRWIKYCKSIHEWVAQRHHIEMPTQPDSEDSITHSELEPGDQSALEGQDFDSEIDDSAVSILASSFQVGQPLLETTQPPIEERPEVRKEKTESTANILADSFSVDGIELRKAIVQPLRPSRPKPPPEVRPKPQPHEGFVVYESAEEPEPAIKPVAKPRKPAPKQPPKKSLKLTWKSKFHIPITMGGFVGMLAILCFLLPWVWLVYSMFSTMILNFFS
ncbi:hypothetical protein HOF92_10795 [bacterium]|jgi:hypothetical protein|nr:hypothetical protein [bacterium]